MNALSVPRSTDTGYRAWADAQSDCWYDEAEVEEEVSEYSETEAVQLDLFEVDELAVDLCATEGMTFMEALQSAEGMLPGLQAYAQDWDRHAGLGGNESVRLF